MDVTTHPNWGRHLFFSELPAYVLSYRDKSGEKRIATERIGNGGAILCYLSPIDALIEVLRFSQIGQRYEVMPAELVPQDAFCDADGRGLISEVHLGWPVLFGRLMTRPSGALSGYSRVMHHWAHEPLRFEFDEVVLAEVARLHEWAGLYAWRETLNDVLGWEANRVGRVVARALASIEFAEYNTAKCLQVALFDPEAEQWHFVPCSQTTV